MSFRTSVTIVCSPRPRVGRTLVARMLADFHMQSGRTVEAFDLNSDHSLSQFLPHHVKAAAIGDIQGQMALFDRLVAQDDIVKIVDLGPATFESFFSVAAQIGFAEEARKRSVAPAIMYLMSPDKAAIDAYAGLLKRFPEAIIAPVQNELIPIGQQREKFPTSGKGSVLVRIPALAPGLRKYIETPPFSFSDSRYSGNDIPLDIHIELQRWARRVFLEFREFDLQMLLADLRSSIQLPI